MAKHKEPAPDELLGPVNEFTLSLSEELVRAAMQSAGQSTALDAPEPQPQVPQSRGQRAPEEAPRRAPQQDPYSPPPDSRFSKARPGSRSLPVPTGPSSAAEPLTTGVVPGLPGPVDTGVVRDRDAVKKPDFARREARSRPPTREAFTDPEPGSGLAEVVMPSPDTGRAQPLQAPPRPGAGPNLARRGSPRPQAPPEGPDTDGEERVDPRGRRKEPLPTETSAVRHLEELLTLADEPPEGEDTVSGTIDMLSMNEAPPEAEVSENSVPRAPIRRIERSPPDASAVSAPPAPRALTALPSAPPRPNRAGAPVVSQRKRPEAPMEPMDAPAPPPPVRTEAEEGTLTSALVPLDEDGSDADADSVPMPGDVVAGKVPKVEQKTRISSKPPPMDDLATRPVELPPASPPQAKALARNPSEARPEKADGDKAIAKDFVGDGESAFGAERQYKEPILAWLASLIGLVLVFGFIFLLLFLVMLMM